MIKVSLQDLQQLISYAVDAGIQKYEQGRNPQGDRIRKGEAEKFVMRCGFQPVMLQKWTDARLLTSVKAGERQNAPTFYSLAEIKGVIASIKLKSMCNQ